MHVRTRTLVTLSAAALAVAFLAAPSEAARIKLRGGKEVVGDIVYKDSERIKVKGKFGIVEYPMEEVESITEEGSPAEEAEKKLKEAKKADDCFAIGEKAKADGLEDLAIRAWKRAIELDPEHEKARAALGFVKKDGKWLTKEEAEKAGAGATGDASGVKKPARRDPNAEAAKAAQEKYRKELEGVPWSQAFKVETKHYIIQCNATKEVAESYAKFMEALYEKYTNVFRNFPILNSDKSTIYILRNQNEFSEMLGMPKGVGGFYRPVPFMGLPERIVVGFHGPFGDTGDTYAVLAHEGTHQFEHKVMKGTGMEFLQRPTWLIEGLAVYFGDGHDVDKKGKIQIGIPRDRLAVLQRALKDGSYVKLADLIRTPQRGFSGFHYAHGWGLIYFMVNVNKEKKDKRGKVTVGGKELDLLNAFNEIWKINVDRPSTPEEFEKAVGCSMAELEPVWKEWILGLKLPSIGKVRGDGYSSEDMAFKVNRPNEKWKFSEEDLAYGEKIAIENEKTTGRITVTATGNMFNQTAEGVKDELPQRLPQRLDSLVFEETKEIEHRGMPGYEMRYRGKERASETIVAKVRPNEQQFRRVILVTPKHIYFVTCQCDADRWKDNEAAFEQAIKSFELLVEKD